MSSPNYGPRLSNTCPQCGKQFPGNYHPLTLCNECCPEPVSSSTVDHPLHYGGAGNPYEAIKVIQAWGLGFCLGNTVKYICRAGKKASAAELEDLQKASWYLQERIKELAHGIAEK